MVYTDYRPTPLQHFIFPAGGDGVFLVVDEKGKFRDDNFQKAMALLGQSGDGCGVNTLSIESGQNMCLMLDEWLQQVHVGLIILLIFVSVATACAKRTGAAASVERRRREPDRAISPE